MRKILILGGTSAIAMECARLFAAQGDEIFLAARGSDKLEALRRDLLVRGAKRVETVVSDLAALEGHAALLEEVRRRMPDFDTVLVAYGSLPDQKVCEQSFELTRQALRVNFVSVVSLLTLIANEFESRRGGTIAVISSVAGDRGRQSNYIYGTAKGALSIFLQGLRNRLHPAGVNVITLKPGFVDTPMTAAFPKGALFVGPEVVAAGIFRAVAKGRDVVYLPWFWRLIMALICSVPESIFKRQHKL
jgi:decaprenylphospho-beta-D-erythro-pentofuranosid-2-ulose 2-reductase